jgi:autotransporter strand-loop-strand O-heptosyltransferase
MKIAQVNLGLLPIPPNGWGAVEKITWTYFLELQKLGHEVTIPYINEVNRGEYDIVHVHAWNHALEMKEKGIPYIFSCHDHHAYIYGKDSIVYKNNLEAMKHAKLAIVPAEYLVEYFENVPVYLQHGVSRNEFKLNTPNSKKKLLCVGNNGLIDQKTFDRKGFRYAIESAKILNMEITVVGPTNVNKQYFEENSDLLSENVTILYDLDDNQLQEVYRTHDILIHATSVEAGHPPLTILEAASSGLPVITTDCSGDLHVTKIKRDVESVVSGIKYVLENYDLEREKTLDSVEKYDWQSVVGILNELYEKNIVMDMRNSALNVYNNAKRVFSSNRIEINFVDGPFVEVLGSDEQNYKVDFIDFDKDETVFSTNISNNTWARSNRKWFTNWMIEITSSNGSKFQHKFDAKGRRVYIVFESSSVGDTLAWLPYVEEFRKEHQCEMIVSTFMNHLFKDQYSEIEFVDPGISVHNLYALYRLGIFYNEDGIDYNRHKTDFKKTSLQECATDILGLSFKEIRPRLKKSEPIKSKKPYVCIATHSTAQSKYWNNSDGWQQVVDYVKSIGYDVYLLSKEQDGYMGNKNPVGVITTNEKTLEEIIPLLLGSKGFIGLSSGITWLSWALNVPTVMISGFSEPYQEMMDVERVINEEVCHGCFARHLFDKGDWNWCPDHKGTERQFECSKSITFEMVRPKIDKILSK